MITKISLGSREEWLKERRKRVGGSEVSALIGMNPYMTNIDLWKLKTGRAEPNDVGDLELVRYGAAAEEYLRELFKLDFPQMKVWHEPDTLFVNSEIPALHASVDGILTDENGRKGILEIKTATMMSGSQWRKWDGRIPDQYYCQILAYMAVLEADFTILKAQLKNPAPEGLSITTRHYFIERADVVDDIRAIIEKAEAFRICVEEDRAPALEIYI